MQYPLLRRSKRKMHQHYFKKPKSECPDICIRLAKHKWPKSWSRMEDPVVPLERNLYGNPLAGVFWERQFVESSIGTRLGKSFELSACGRYQTGRQNRKHRTDLENSHERR